MKDRVKVETEYAQSPERVWRALTDKERLSKWLLPTPDFAPKPGHRFHFVRGRERIACTVREAEAPRRLVCSWREENETEAEAGQVTWTLTPTERGGTRLTVTHETGNNPRTLMALSGSGARLQNCLHTSRPVLTRRRLARIGRERISYNELRPLCFGAESSRRTLV